MLTVLAVALAAALLTALLTIAGTAETRALDELANGGPLAGIKVAAAAPDPRQLGQDDARPGDPRILDDEALNRIAALPDVRTAIPIVTAGMFVTVPAETASGRRMRPFFTTAVGVDLSAASSLPISILAGRLPAPGSLTEAAVTEGWLERLGLEPTEAANVLGTETKMAAGRIREDGECCVGRWIRLEVVGVVAQEAASGQLLVPLEQAQLARDWSGQGPDGGREFDVSPSPYNGLFVVADGIDAVTTARAEITEIGYSTSAPENLIASVRRYLHVVEIILAAVGAIALVIAALGITNALLAAVRERRREIGVLKAIGARDRDVLAIFLVEASALGLAGGLLGTAVGWLTAAGVGQIVNSYLVDQGLVPVEVGLPVVVLLGGIAGSTLLALGGGVLPAMRAARLPAREAVSGA